MVFYHWRYPERSDYYRLLESGFEAFAWKWPEPHPNGMRSEGEFREGKPWNTRAYDSNRKLLFRVQQGTIIRKNDD